MAVGGRNRVGWEEGRSALHACSEVFDYKPRCRQNSCNNSGPKCSKQDRPYCESQAKGLEAAPERNRKTTWKEFLCRHRQVMVAADFFHRRGLDAEELDEIPGALPNRPGRQTILDPRPGSCSA